MAEGHLPTVQEEVQNRLGKSSTIKTIRELLLLIKTMYLFLCRQLSNVLQIAIRVNCGECTLFENTIQKTFLSRASFYRKFAAKQMMNTLITCIEIESLELKMMYPSILGVVVIVEVNALNDQIESNVNIFRMIQMHRNLLSVFK